MDMLLMWFEKASHLVTCDDPAYQVFNSPTVEIDAGEKAMLKAHQGHQLRH